MEIKECLKKSRVEPSLYLLELSLSTLADKLNVTRCEYDCVNSRVIIYVPNIDAAESTLHMTANYAHEINVAGILIREDGDR